MVYTPTLIIINIILFVLVFLFLKTIDTRKWLVFIITLVLTPVVYFYVFYPISNIFCTYHHQKTFDAESWKEKPGLRYEMIQHIEENKTLVGKTKEEALKDLGKAEWLSWDFDNNQFNNNAWNFNLGKLPGAFTKTAKQVEVIFENDKIDHLVVKTVELKEEGENENDQE
ncbi:MAG: hypothetical protein HRT68_13820 [Flavobacteriaceae bacterium]|nr:hypothetical protein [Flavobacteriaceae bacterium]